MKIGGLSEVKEVDDSVKVITSSIYKSLVNELSLNFGDKINIHSYKTQVVAGIIFFIKISINNKFYHIKVMNYLPHTNQEPELLSVLSNQAADSEIIFY